MADYIIKARGLTKKYGRKLILDSVDLNVYKGETVALIGKNGCGKSTLLRVVCGLSKKNEGILELPEKVKFQYVPERFAKTSFTIPQFVRHMARIEGVDEKEAEERFEKLSRMFYLKEMLGTPMRYLSKGTLQKAAVIQALIGKPDVLLLDEPLSGQDMYSQRNFIACMKEMKELGVTVLLACHEKYLVEALADRVYKIDKRKCTEITSLEGELMDESTRELSYEKLF